MVTPGRNQPCPCGSGGKYKRCCLARDEETARHGLPVEAAGGEKGDPGDVVRALAGMMEVVASRDVKDLRRRLQRLGDLLAEGPLRDLRFDRAAFARSVDRAIGARKVPDGDWEALFERVADELVRADFVERFLDALMTFASARGTSGDDRDAAMAGVVTTVSFKDGTKAADLSMALGLKVLFRVQLAELGRARGEVRDTIDHLAEEFRAGRMSSRQVSDEVERRLGQQDGNLVLPAALEKKLGQQIDASVKRARAAFEGRHPPAVFSLDELLWLMRAAVCALPEIARTARLDGDARSAAGHRFVEAIAEALDEDLASDAVDRLMRIAADESQSRATRRLCGDLAVGMHAQPLGVGGTAFARGGLRPIWREADEEVHGRRLLSLPRWRPTDLEPYEQYLRAAGEARAAARVEKLRGILPEEGLDLTFGSPAPPLVTGASARDA